MNDMSQAECEKIKELLQSAGASFEEIEHEAVRTSAEAAAVRGQKLSQGVKALLVKFKRKGKEFFAIVDLPADKKADWKKAKKVLQASEVKLASEAEVLEQTGCEPGGVAPLGHKNKLPILVDPAVFAEEVVEFNAGLKTKSIRIASGELRKTLEKVGVAYFELAE